MIRFVWRYNVCNFIWPWPWTTRGTFKHQLTLFLEFFHRPSLWWGIFPLYFYFWVQTHSLPGVSAEIWMLPCDKWCVHSSKALDILFLKASHTYIIRWQSREPLDLVRRKFFNGFVILNYVLYIIRLMSLPKCWAFCKKMQKSKMAANVYIAKN